MHRAFPFLTRLLCVAAVFAILSSSARAAITSSGDVDPADPAGWSSSVVGHVGMHADGEVLVYEEGDLQSHSAIIAHDAGVSGAVTVDGVGSTWTNRAALGFSLTVGARGDGELTIVRGATVECGNNSEVGGRPGSTGSVRVDGDGSTWSNVNHLYVGRDGRGSMEIVRGGTVDNFYGYVGFGAAAAGTVRVEGSGSTWANRGFLSIGEDGDGELFVAGGGEVRCRDSSIGRESGSVGTATVVGTDSLWTCSDQLSVGSGALNVLEGGEVRSERALIRGGWHFDAVATVDGEGSKWTIASTRYPGLAVGGRLNVLNGGTVEGTSAVVSVGGEGRTAVVRVDGAGSTWIQSKGVVLGNRGGNGELHVTEGGAVRALAGEIGKEPYSTCSAVVHGAGSTWTNDLWLRVGGRSRGTLLISDGGRVNAGEYGAIIGVDTYGEGIVRVEGVGSTLINDGREFYVGLSGSGLLEIVDGGLVSVSGTMVIDRNGGNDAFVNMKTGGRLALFGDLDGSLDEFLARVEGNGTINYWDDYGQRWSPLAQATPGVDYTLEHLSEGDLTGYTLLTVGLVPEPSGICLLIAAACVCAAFHRCTPGMRRSGVE